MMCDKGTMSQRHLDPEECLIALSLYYSGIPQDALTTRQLEGQSDFIDNFIIKNTGLEYFKQSHEILTIRYAYFEMRGWHMAVPPRYQGGLQKFQ